MRRIYDAQNELSAATHLTSKLLKEYEKQRFPLGGDDEVMTSTLQQFAKVIDELSSCHAVLSTQLADAMMFPISQFKERDLKEILTLKEVFQISSNDHDVAINRYSRLSKRRENEKASMTCSYLLMKTTPSRPHASRANSTGSMGSDASVLTALSLDSIVAPDTPIQFDIISPVSEDQSGQPRTPGQSGRRTNPFGESGDRSESEDCILHQLYIVRFLGSMEVKAEESTEVVYETMRQILAARAIHNIFRMTESHLLVTCDCLKLIDPQTQVTRLRFPLPNVVLCATHQENKRLFGFVLRTAGGRAEGRPVSVCYIFESNNEGEKICDSVGLAKQIALHAELDRRASEKQKEIEKVKEKQQKEISKQKQIEKDLEEQSRLIAASSRPIQAGTEGQFVVLSSSQSEDSDAGEDGKKKRESDA
ncbi:hypothetical protein FKM82_004320 [Ascaphus truei]